MSEPIIYLDHQYHNIEDAIKSAEYSQDELFDEYGEKLNHYLLLSELAKVFTCSGIKISTAKLAAFIVHFELAEFKPLGYLPQPFEEANLFIGEILYANNDLALCRISSVKYSPLSVVITVSKETKPLELPFHFSPDNLSDHYNLKINAVI